MHRYCSGAQNSHLSTYPNPQTIQTTFGYQQTQLKNFASLAEREVIWHQLYLREECVCVTRCWFKKTKVEVRGWVGGLTQQNCML